MRLSDALWIPFGQRQTWNALSDEAVLRACIPGCIRVERRSPAEYTLRLRARVAGQEVEYEGEVLLADVNDPQGCTLAFEGKGTAAGLFIGTAQVNLSPKDGGTRVAYTIAAMAGGKLAEAGQRALMKGTERIVGEFFAAFADHMAHQPREEPPDPELEPHGLAYSAWSWAAFFAVILIFLIYHGCIKK